LKSVAAHAAGVLQLEREAGRLAEPAHRRRIEREDLRVANLVAPDRASHDRNRRRRCSAPLRSSHGFKAMKPLAGILAATRRHRRRHR
jgi:hypothetical protein